MMAAFKGTSMKPNPDRNPAVVGDIPGFPVGSTWGGRRDICDDGVHAYLMRGIHGRGDEGAFSVVLSGGYPDDEDHGEIVIYTGEGGRSPRKKDESESWNSDTVADQTWRYGNKALMTSYQTQDPIRVIRGHTLGGKYAPLEGYRYDGLYTVQEAKLARGVTGFQVCRFRFERCPNQLPIPVRETVSPAPDTRELSPEVTMQRKIKPIYPSPSITPAAYRPNAKEDQQDRRHKSEDSDIAIPDITPSYSGRGSKNEPCVIFDDEDDGYLCKDEFGNNNVISTVVAPKIIGRGSKSEPYLLVDEGREDEEDEDEDVDMLESDSE